MSVRPASFLIRTAALLAPLSLMTACPADDVDQASESDPGTETESPTTGATDTPTTGETETPTTGTPTTSTTTGDPVELPEGCNYYVPEPSDSAEDDLVTALVDVQPGEVVCVGEGTFSFTGQLTITEDDVTLRGAGQDLTVFDFSNQTSGANGILINGDRNLMDSFTVVDTPGDGIRANDVEGITFLNVTAGWTAEQSEDNGAYALYPVQSTNVVVDGCVTYNARDAGVYLGQSTNSLIQNSEAYGNVIGIEVENSTDTLVRNNHTHDNTVGFLVITLPGLDILDGKRANLHGNRVNDNNIPNFGDPGTTVGIMPPGFGILVVATDRNEFWDNEITGNRSGAIGMISFLEDLLGEPNDRDFDIYSEGNYIHDNTMTGNAEDPEQLVLLLNGNAVPGPDVIVDGCYNPRVEQEGEALNCLALGDATFYNADQCQQQGGANDDVSVYDCTQEPLPTDSPVDPA